MVGVRFLVPSALFVSSSVPFTSHYVPARGPSFSRTARRTNVERGRTERKRGGRDRWGGYGGGMEGVSVRCGRKRLTVIASWLRSSPLSTRYPFHSLLAAKRPPPGVKREGWRNGNDGERRHETRPREPQVNERRVECEAVRLFRLRFIPSLFTYAHHSPVP